MKKIIVSIIAIGLLLTTSIASVTVFGEKDSQYNELQFHGIPYANIYVDDSNTQGPWDGTYEHPYQHIQDGINAAENGNTVFVFNGTYYENIILNKQIDLIGEDKINTVIDGNNLDNVIEINSGSTKISGFTIEKSGTGDLKDAGIVVWSGHATINDNFITQNEEGIWLYQGNNLVSGNIITENEIWGIDVASSNNQITENTILRCGSSFGAGMRIIDESNNNISSNNINNNYGPGIIAILGQNNNINDNIIRNNSGSGIEFSSANSIISENVIENNNKGIVISGKSNIIVKNTVSKNALGIFLDFQTENSIVKENNINKNLVGIKLEDATNNSIVHNNLIDNILDATFTFNHVLGQDEKYREGEIPASFDTSKIYSNTWYQNYWNGPRLFPKIIIGQLQIYIYWWPGPGLIKIFTIPLINYDPDPLDKPYGDSQNYNLNCQSSQQSSITTTQQSVPSTTTPTSTPATTVTTTISTAPTCKSTSLPTNR